MRTWVLYACLAWLVGFAAPALSQDMTPLPQTTAPDADAPEQPDPAKTPPALEALAARLHPQHGTVTLKDGLASLTLPGDLAYLPPDEAVLYMYQVVGYPLRSKPLGLIIPANVAVGSKASWSALITHREDGFLKDADHAAPDASALLTAIMEENRAALAKLDAAGYAKMGASVTGWLAKPVYDAASHTLIWATEIQPRDADAPLLNYFIKVFGRKGTLSVPIVAPVEQLPAIEDAARKIAASIKFNAPFRYEDITASDAGAPYTIDDIIEGHPLTPPTSPPP